MIFDSKHSNPKEKLKMWNDCKSRGRNRENCLWRIETGGCWVGGENWRKRRVFFSLHFHFSSGKPRSERLSICSKLSLFVCGCFSWFDDEKVHIRGSLAYSRTECQWYYEYACLKISYFNILRFLPFITLLKHVYDFVIRTALYII